MRNSSSIIPALIPIAALCLASAARPDSGPPSRAAAISASIRTLDQECRLDGDGQWDKWFNRLAGFRAALAQKRAAALALRGVPGNHGDMLRLVESGGRPALYYDANLANYLAEPSANLKAWAEARPSRNVISGIAKGLKRKFNIDVIFVPVPTILEVYADQFASGVPRDRIAAPHLRYLIRQFLEDDVEVVDLLPALLAARESAKEPLYYPSDPHWSGAGLKVGATEIAARLERYAFVRQAMREPRHFKREEIRVPYIGYYLRAMTPQQVSGLSAYSTAGFRKVTDLQGALLKEAKTSPVVMVGDSFVLYSTLIAKGTSLVDLIAEAINIQPAFASVEGGAVASIVDLIRNPEMRSSCKTLVWVINMEAAAVGGPWTLPSVFAR